MAEQLATYKGRQYLLLWSGKTKFGTKAKLAFMDRSKEFWVDLSLVTVGAAAPSNHVRRSGGGAVCAECGKAGSLVADLEDGLRKHRRCCDMPPGEY